MSVLCVTSVPPVLAFVNHGLSRAMPAGPPVSLPQPGGEDWGGNGGAAKRPHAGEPDPGDHNAGAAQPPVQDVFRQRRKLQRTRAAGGEAG